jgi:8-oxo-dGTP pyrophosphatase MutT (NUDIX family)
VKILAQPRAFSQGDPSWGVETHAIMIQGDDLERREDVQISAGGVLYRRNGHHVQVCLISKKGGRVWALPKGRLDDGESPEQTAKREILEETGHLAEVHEKIDEISYYFHWKENNTLYHKIVSYYLMPLVRENEAERDGEADAVAWMSMGEAYRRLSYLNEKEIMRKAQRLLKTEGAS